MKLSTCLASLCLTSVTIASSFFDQQVVFSSGDSSLSVPGENPLTFCEAPDEDILVINKVDLSPNPPEAGKILKIEAKGNFTKEIEKGAFVYLTVKYGLIRLVNVKEDLCDQLAKIDKECPIPEGETTITKEVELPGRIPPGKYTVHADVYTKDEAKITCLDATVTFSR